MPKTTAPTRRLVSLSEAADYLGVTALTVRRRIADGRLTGYRIGPKVLRVDLNEVEALVSPIPTAEARVPDLDPASAPMPDRLAEHVRRLVDAAPPLSDDQRDDLARLLRGARSA